MECPGKARLRGEMRIERNLRQRQRTGCQFRHGLLEADPAYVAVRRYANGKRELARKVKGAVASYFCEVRQRDVARNVCLDIFEDAAQSHVIEPVRGLACRCASPAIAMLVKEAGRKRQGRRFDKDPARGFLDGKFGHDGTSDLFDDTVADADRQLNRMCGSDRKIEIVLQSIEKRRWQVQGHGLGNWRRYLDPLGDPGGAQPYCA